MYSTTLGPCVASDFVEAVICNINMAIRFPALLFANQIVPEIRYPVHWLTDEVAAMAKSLYLEAEETEHAMPLNLMFWRPPHCRRAPRSTSALTTVAPRRTPPRSRQPEAPTNLCRHGKLCIASHLIAAYQHGARPAATHPSFQET